MNLKTVLIPEGSRRAYALVVPAGFTVGKMEALGHLSLAIKDLEEQVTESQLFCQL